MENKVLAQELLQEGNSVLRLAPAWVPRSFCRPGRRLKLHPDDYYALGLERGGIDERWFASAQYCQNVFFHSVDYRASRFEFLFLVPFVIFSLCTHVQMFV